MQSLARLGIRLLEGLLVGLLGLMVVLVFGNVVLRYGFNSGLVFSEEVSRFIFMWLTLLGALVALHDGAHLGMSSLVERLPPRGRRVCRFTSDAMMLGCCALLAHAAPDFYCVALHCCCAPGHGAAAVLEHSIVVPS